MTDHGSTHSLGDACPGGHYDEPSVTEAEIATLRARVAHLEAGIRAISDDWSNRDQGGAWNGCLCPDLDWLEDDVDRLLSDQEEHS